MPEPSPQIQKWMIWRCPECGERERATGRWKRSAEFKGGEETPRHWHWERGAPRGFVEAEEVEVIPAIDAQKVEAERDAAFEVLRLLDREARLNPWEYGQIGAVLRPKEPRR